MPESSAPNSAAVSSIRFAEPHRVGPLASASAEANDKSKAERSNKKAEVIGMMKLVKGATLAEIMEAPGWQTHTVRGFVSILGKNGGERSSR